jgi:tetrahydromethanopterin S-methyltransferase subunit H
MWKFGVEQKRFEIGTVKIGGLPGERPTVLIGSIFYRGQKILKNEMTGDFDSAKAEEMIKVQEEFSEKTGNPHMLDVVASTPDAMKKYIDFISGITDAPILLDGISANVRIAALEYIKEHAIKNEIVYNSLTPEYKQEEIEKIKEIGIKSAILLAYNVREFTSEGRVKAIKALLPVANKAGIKSPLIDTCVLDIPSLGMASRAIFELKRELGLPTGCGAHNAIGTWKGLKKKMGNRATHPTMAVASGIAVAVGADFVLYGPIESADYMFPAIAMIDAAYGQLVMEQGKMLDRSHPIFKIA